MGAIALTKQEKKNRTIANKIRASENYNRIEYDGGGYLEHPPDGKQNPDEEQLNRDTYGLLAKEGLRYRILPVVNLERVKNPDAINCGTGMFSDAKHPTTRRGKNIGRAIHSAIRSANEQGAQEVVIRLIHEYKQHDIEKGFASAFKFGSHSDIRVVILIYSNNHIKIQSGESLRSRYKSQRGHQINDVPLEAGDLN